MQLENLTDEVGNMPIVRANGININYEERGAGEPLILIMGLGADGSAWELHAQVYEQHFRCILMDNRGAGLSDKPEGPYTTAMMADDTAGLMDALGIETAHVAGISMGGAIAQNLALRYPTKVRCMVLVSTWAQCDTYTRIVFEHFKKMRVAADPGDFTELLQLWIFAAEHVEAQHEDLLQAQQEARANENPMPQHAFDAQCDACTTHDTLENLHRIQIPTLITVGDTDIFTPYRFSKVIHENITGSELFVLDRVGHAHHWEKLDEFNHKTTTFLQSH
jgi:pimeloyl-ACP methyl ester carboxylesterase